MGIALEGSAPQCSQEPSSSHTEQDSLPPSPVPVMAQRAGGWGGGLRDLEKRQGQWVLWETGRGWRVLGEMTKVSGSRWGER